jgi:hypothetical protein
MAQPAPGTMATATAEQLTACLKAQSFSFMSMTAGNVPYDVPCTYISSVRNEPPGQSEPPFVLTDAQASAIAHSWSQLDDATKLAWYRAAVAAPAWNAWRATQTATFRVQLFSQFGTTAEAASPVQIALVDALEQAPRALHAAQDVVARIDNANARSDPAIRQRIENLAELSAMGQDDTLRAIVQGYSPQLPAGALLLSLHRAISVSCGSLLLPHA